MSNKISTGLTGVLFLIVLLLAAPTFANEPTSEDRIGVDGAEQQADESFHQFITAIDILLTREQMEERWPDASQRLIDVAENQEASEFERWRATSILTNFKEPHVKEALIGLTGDSVVRVRSMAYYVLGTNFLAEGDDALFARLELGLQDENERVRAEVIRSFGWTDNTRAHQVLRQVASQTDHELQSTAERSLERLAQ